MEVPVKAAIYCRVSTEEQAREGFSIAAQKKTLMSFCMMKGWETIRIYTDEGISGKTTCRPAFQELLQDAKHNMFNTVLVWKINRFSRRNSDLLNTVEYLSSLGINLISYCEQFDASTPSGRLMLSMLGSIGEFERDTIIENIRSGMTERACQGLFNGGKVLGYDNVNGKLVVNEEEALTVKRIYELYLSGYGYKGIADILGNENRKTKNNCSFSINAVKRILKNPIYTGYITYNKTKKAGSGKIECGSFLAVPGKHTPLISKDQFDRVQEIINSRKQAYSSFNDFILSGLLRCPFCGGRMTGHKKNKKKDGTYYRYYICLNYKNFGPSRCKPACINASDIENKIIDYVCSIISSKRVADDIYGRISEMYKGSGAYGEVRMLEKELVRKRASRDRYFKLFEGNTIDGQILSQKIKLIDTEIENILKRINELQNLKLSSIGGMPPQRISAELSNFRCIFNSLEVDIKKRLLYSIIKDIRLNQNKAIENIRLNFVP